MRVALSLTSLVLTTALVSCSSGEGEGSTGSGAAATSAGQATAPAAEFEDRFNLIGMAHTSPSTARGLPIEVETSPWDGKETGGPFSFASAPCSADAPINNVSTNLASLNTRLEGSRSPASTRLHPLEFEVVSLEEGEGELRGSVDLTVCQPRFGVTPPDDPIPDAERDRIRFTFTADFVQPTPEETTWQGEFRIESGTGAYEGMEGSGQIGGYFMCLGPDRCAQVGGFRDAQVTMIGSYRAPQTD
ncbi:MAG: hypothetical protein M3P89_09875 [Actinomycetota bacterium]|nr:hypothetical protein [Actinomycetota bacterium]